MGGGVQEVTNILSDFLQMDIKSVISNVMFKMIV